MSFWKCVGLDGSCFGECFDACDCVQITFRQKLTLGLKDEMIKSWSLLFGQRPITHLLIMAFITQISNRIKMIKEC